MKSLIAVMVGITMLAASAAGAAVVTINSINLKWTSVTGGSGVSGLGTDTLSWGSTTARSSYTLAGIATPVIVGSPFEFGTLTHDNSPIPSGSGITAASLEADVFGDVDGVAFSLGFMADLKHEETPNACAPLPVCANDLVTLISSSPTGASVIVDGEKVDLTMLGFFSGVDFSSPEGGMNSAGLVASFEVSQVPLPAGFPLLMAGIGVFGLMRLQKRKT